MTPLIIAGTPGENPEAPLYRQADELAGQLVPQKDFTIDWTSRSVELTPHGQTRLDELAEAAGLHPGVRAATR